MIAKDVNLTITGYAPSKFKEIMEIDGISYNDMIYSLKVDINRDRIFKAGQGSGKSGSFFFFSHDNKFLIKTLKGQEKKVMLDMLDDFISHIK